MEVHKNTWSGGQTSPLLHRHVLLAQSVFKLERNEKRTNKRLVYVSLMVYHASNNHYHGDWKFSLNQVTNNSAKAIAKGKESSSGTTVTFAQLTVLFDLVLRSEQVCQDSRKRWLLCHMSKKTCTGFL